MEPWIVFYLFRIFFFLYNLNTNTCKCQVCQSLKVKKSGKFNFSLFLPNFGSQVSDKRHIENNLLKTHLVNYTQAIKSESSLVSSCWSDGQHSQLRCPALVWPIDCMQPWAESSWRHPMVMNRFCSLVIGFPVSGILRLQLVKHTCRLLSRLCLATKLATHTTLLPVTLQMIPKNDQIVGGDKIVFLFVLEPFWRPLLAKCENAGFWQCSWLHSFLFSF